MSFLPVLALMPGPMEWCIIAGVALLIFGKRLPEVGRSLGKGIVEFKRGLKDVTADVDEAGNTPAGAPPSSAPPTGAKFDPYTGKPLDSTVQR